MARPKSRGDLKALNMNINAEVAEKLNDINTTTGIPKTIIVERALVEYFEKYERELNAFGMKSLDIKK